MFVYFFFLFLGVMLFPSVRTGITAPWIIEWSISTMDLEVLLNYNYFYLVFIFGSFCLRAMLSSCHRLCSVVLSSDQQKDNMVDTSGQNEFPFSDSWVHLRRNRCSFIWKGFISRAELKIFLNFSSFLFIFVYFCLGLRAVLSTSLHHL